MSLILEALRKSEAERRRGQVPDLHTGPSPGAPPLRDGPPARLWLALVLATAVVVALALMFARRTPPLSPPAVDVPTAATVVDGDRPVDPDVDAGPRNKAISSVGSSGRPDDRASADATPAWTPPPGRPAEVAQTTDARPLAAAPSKPPARAPTTTNAVGPAAPAPAPVVAVPATPPPSAPAVAAAPARTPVPATVVATTATPTPAAAQGSAPLRLSDLTVAQRQQLPPLKMSMHMWSATQRFAIIDGSRVAAGDRLGDVVVEEITATGVVLDWQGQRLQIPMR